MLKYICQQIFCSPTLKKFPKYCRTTVHHITEIWRKNMYKHILYINHTLHCWELKTWDQRVRQIVCWGWCYCMWLILSMLIVQCSKMPALQILWSMYHNWVLSKNSNCLGTLQEACFAISLHCSALHSIFLQVMETACNCCHRDHYILSDLIL